MSLTANLNINTDSVLQEGYLCVHCQRRLLKIQREHKELQAKVQQIISYVQTVARIKPSNLSNAPVSEVQRITAAEQILATVSWSPNKSTLCTFVTSTSNSSSSIIVVSVHGMAGTYYVGTQFIQNTAHLCNLSFIMKLYNQWNLNWQVYRINAHIKYIIPLAICSECFDSICQLMLDSWSLNSSRCSTMILQIV